MIDFNIIYLISGSTDADTWTKFGLFPPNYIIQSAFVLITFTISNQSMHVPLPLCIDYHCVPDNCNGFCECNEHCTFFNVLCINQQTGSLTVLSRLPTINYKCPVTFYRVGINESCIDILLVSLIADADWFMFLC